MRLFTGLDLPTGIIAELDGVIERLKPSARVNWSPAANLHITTKFIGEWPAERIDDLKAALGTVASPALPIKVRGLGWFPNPHNPGSFWAAVHGGEGLRALAASTDEALASLGIRRETRPLTPHLTLARIKRGSDVREMRRQVAELPSQDWGRFEARFFHLYLSEPGPSSSVYTKLADFPMDG